MSDTEHVVLIHGSWSRGEQWAPARAALEERGYTVHSPTLRHHELPLPEGGSTIAPLSLRDDTDDLVALVASLDTPPLVVAHPWAACRPTAFDAIHRGQDRGDRCCRRSGYQGR